MPFRWAVPARRCPVCTAFMRNVSTSGCGPMPPVPFASIMWNDATLFTGVQLIHHLPPVCCSSITLANKFVEDIISTMTPYIWFEVSLPNDAFNFKFVLMTRQTSLAKRPHSTNHQAVYQSLPLWSARLVRRLHVEVVGNIVVFGDDMAAGDALGIIVVSGGRPSKSVWQNCIVFANNKTTMKTRVHG